jgi:hypothetical protein
MRGIFTKYIWGLTGLFLCSCILPKADLTLSSKTEMPHMEIHSGGKLNLKCEDFYQDFKAACEEVNHMDFKATDKMNKDLIEVPEASFNMDGKSKTSVTESVDSGLIKHLTTPSINASGNT